MAQRGRPQTVEGAQEDAQVEQLAFAFEFSRYLTLVRTTQAQTLHLARHDRWEREALERLDELLIDGDLRAARVLVSDLREADRVENARHRLLRTVSA